MSKKRLAWSEDEVNYLSSQLKCKHREQIAKDLGRSIGSIHSKIRRLGIHSDYHKRGNNHMLLDSEAAYIGGLFDGEGNITMQKQKTKLCQRGYIIRLLTRIDNTNKNAIDYIAQATHIGKVYTFKKNNRKPLYCWHLGRLADIKAFLEQLLPYLIIKREQTQLALEYCKRRLNKGYHATYDERELELLDEIPLLNCKGARNDPRVNRV